MPSPGTKPRQIRIPDDEWNEFDRAAKRMGTERSGEIRAFIAWYLRRPGAKMPKRPEPSAEVTPP